MGFRADDKGYAAVTSRGNWNRIDEEKKKEKKRTRKRYRKKGQAESFNGTGQPYVMDSFSDAISRVTKPSSVGWKNKIL